MSLAVDGFWKAGFWETTFWADGFWREGEPIVPISIIGATASVKRVGSMTASVKRVGSMTASVKTLGNEAKIA